VTLAVLPRRDVSSLAKIGKSIGMAVVPRPLDSSPLSPQRKTAPSARPARRKDDVFRQVSWLAGLNPSPPSQALRTMPSGKLKKDSPPTVAGAAPDLPRHRNGEAHRIPFWPVDATGAPEPRDGRRRRYFCQRPKVHFPV